VLNFGRFKLGAMCAGGAKVAIGQAAVYAAGRRQFGQPIASFGAIKHKLGEMVTRTYAIESLVYRTAGMIDQWIERSTAGPHEAVVLAALEEFAIEASIAKVSGSEALDYVLDENIQIHGGNGFVRDYPAERQYRDSRVNRIFEGTNEINRLLIPGMLVRRALKGDVPLIAAARQLQDEILSGPTASESGSDGLLERERRAIASFKKISLMVLGTAMQTYGEKLTDQQELLTCAADIFIDTYASESAVLRAMAAADQKIPTAALQADAASVYVNDAAGRIEMTAKNALAAMADGDSLRTLLAALRRLLKVTPVNTVVLRRRLADETTARGSYPFNG
jgi:alkylation response protein AidB-like acyl-CoA dehydrogenase